MEKMKRNSGLELLRIICMLLIMLYHYSTHGGFEPFSHYSFSGGVVFVQFITLFGRISCSVFALISGYYLTASFKKSYDTNILLKKSCKRIVPLVAEMHLYYGLILIIFLLAGTKWITGGLIVKSMLPVFFGTWYIIFYIIFLALLPFLLPWIANISKEDFKKFLLVLFLIWSVVPTLAADGVWEFSGIDFFLVMFFVGAYIKLHVNRLPSKRKRLFTTMVFLGLIVLSVIAFDLLGIITGKSIFIDKATYFEKFNGILGLGFAVSLFVYFLDFNFYNKTINTIASSTLGIYLIHNNFIFRRWFWREFYPNPEYIQNPYLHVFVKIIGCFLVCVLIDLIRQRTVGKWISRWNEAHFDALWKWVSGLGKKMIVTVEKWGKE